jgi:hypothetical protein
MAASIGRTVACMWAGVKGRRGYKEAQKKTLDISAIVRFRYEQGDREGSFTYYR